MRVYEKIIALLEEHAIPFKALEHEPVLTSEQAAAVRGNDLGMGAKAMVLRSEGRFYMAVISARKRIHLKKLKSIIGTKSLSFATPAEVKEVTHCEVGGVPPFGNLFHIPVYLDDHILHYDRIEFNAGRRTHSIELNLKDYLRIVQPRIVQFAKA